MVSLGWKEGGRKKTSAVLGGESLGVVGVVVDWIWQGGEVEAGHMIHDLLSCMVDALTEYR